jgi:hypothetical protein
VRSTLTSALLVVSACSSSNPDEQRQSLDRLHQDRRCAEAVNLYGNEPEGGVVSSVGVAEDVAFRYLSAIYPDDRHIRPMRASLRNGVWTVNGTLPKDWIGGVAGIELCQSNGRVLTIAHGK